MTAATTTPPRTTHVRRTVDEHWRRCVLWAAGIVTLTFGIAAMLASTHGSSGIDVVISGVANTAGISIAVSAVAVNTVLVAAAVVVLRARLQPATVAAAVTMGPLIGMWLATLGPAGGGWSYVLVVAGIVSIGVGAAASVAANYGPSPLDVFVVAVAGERWPLRRSRIAVETAAVAAGAVMGGAAGWATVAGAVFIGVVFAATFPLFTACARPRHAHSGH